MKKTRTNHSACREQLALHRLYSPGALLSGTIVVALFVFGVVLIPKHAAAEVPFPPFGGVIVSVLPCFYCPSPSCATWYATVVNGPETFDVVYVPTYTMLRAWYNPVPGAFTKGDGIPGVCYSGKIKHGDWHFTKMAGIDLWMRQMGTSKLP